MSRWLAITPSFNFHKKKIVLHGCRTIFFRKRETKNGKRETVTSCLSVNYHGRLDSLFLRIPHINPCFSGVYVFKGKIKRETNFLTVCV